jgi:hypothetical protein
MTVFLIFSGIIKLVEKFFRKKVFEMIQVFAKRSKISVNETARNIRIKDP